MTSFGALAFLALAVALPAYAQSRPGDVIPGQYIVRLKKGADPQKTALKFRGAGARHFRHALNGFAARMSLSDVRKLEADASVASVEPDRIVSIDKTDTTATSEPNPPWGLDRIDQRALPLSSTYEYSGTGAGVTAYVIDTGVLFNHSEFGGRARLGFDAVDASTGSSQGGVDCHGHGTHVAGTLGGATYGVAKEVQIVAVRVLSCTGSGQMSDIIAGVDWVAANHSGPSVANISLGAGGQSPALESAVEGMIASGVTVAIAAGNSATDACNFTPARTPSAITVGATDNVDARAIYSNYGSCLDLFAPGDFILSAGISSPTASATLSGTSMASPHVAGAAALYLAQHPGSSPQQIRDALVSSATQGIVADSYSANNHLLFVGTDAPPPPPSQSFRAEQWGTSGDQPVSGRFFARAAGEPMADDLGIYRPSTHDFWLKKSGSSNYVNYHWGVDGDIPVTGDFLGKGTTQIGVFRPSDGVWYILDPIDLTFRAMQWGASGDVPVPGDYLGTGRTDAAVFRPSTGMFYIRNFVEPDRWKGIPWGASGDVPVAGDFLGTGHDQIAMFRPSEGNWYIFDPIYSQTRLAHWGTSGDRPVPGRYKSYFGAQRSQLAVYRSSDSTFYALDLPTGQNFSLAWGMSGDIPVVGDFNGSGRVTPTIFRPNGGQWWIHDGF